jgi:membrane-associated phospholipid phosphatase
MIVTICKRVLFKGLARPRKLIGDEMLHFVSGIDVHFVNSFPSGHTATAFALALFVGLLSQNRLIGVLSVVMAFLVGYSRVYLAQHFVVDAAAGATLGTLVAYITWHALAKSRIPWMNQRLRWLSKPAPKPGHSVKDAL